MAQKTENKKDKKTYKYDVIQVTVTKNQRNRVEKYAEKTNHKTNSSFIRTAINEYIMKINHPDIYGHSDKYNELYEEIVKNRKIIEEFIKLEAEKDAELKKLKETVEQMHEIYKEEYDKKKHDKKQDLTKEMNIVKELFKSGKTYAPKDIIEETGIKKDTIFLILPELQESKFIKTTARGRYVINE